MASARASELIRGGGGLDASDDLAVAVEPPATAAHTSVCFWSTAACSRTLGWTIVFAAVNCELLPIQRPCSTQKTSSGNGSAPAGRTCSLPTHLSCLPHLPSSPATHT